METKFETKEEYLQVRKAWSDAINSSERDNMSFGHHLIYKELCGKSWKECLAPTTRYETIAYISLPKHFFKDIASDEVLTSITDKIMSESKVALKVLRREIYE